MDKNLSKVTWRYWNELPLLQYFTLDRFLLTAVAATISCLLNRRSSNITWSYKIVNQILETVSGQLPMRKIAPYLGLGLGLGLGRAIFLEELKRYPWRNLFLVRLWSTVCNFARKQILSHIFSRTLLKVSRILFFGASLWWLLL